MNHRKICSLYKNSRKQHSITDEDVEFFKQKNNLKTDVDAINFLLHKIAPSKKAI